MSNDNVPNSLDNASGVFFTNIVNHVNQFYCRIFCEIAHVKAILLFS